MSFQIADLLRILAPLVALSVILTLPKVSWYLFTILPIVAVQFALPNKTPISHRRLAANMALVLSILAYSSTTLLCEIGLYFWYLCMPFASWLPGDCSAWGWSGNACMGDWRRRVGGIHPHDDYSQSLEYLCVVSTILLVYVSLLSYDLWVNRNSTTSQNSDARLDEILRRLDRIDQKTHVQVFDPQALMAQNRQIVEMLKAVRDEQTKTAQLLDRLSGEVNLLWFKHSSSPRPRQDVPSLADRIRRTTRFPGIATTPPPSEAAPQPPRRKAAVQLTSQQPVREAPFTKPATPPPTAAERPAPANEHALVDVSVDSQVGEELPAGTLAQSSQEDLTSLEMSGLLGLRMSPPFAAAPMDADVVAPGLDAEAGASSPGAESQVGDTQEEVPVSTAESANPEEVEGVPLAPSVETSTPAAPPSPPAQAEDLHSLQDGGSASEGPSASIEEVPVVPLAGPCLRVRIMEPAAQVAEEPRLQVHEEHDAASVSAEPSHDSLGFTPDGLLLESGVEQDPTVEMQDALAANAHDEVALFDELYTSSVVDTDLAVVVEEGAEPMDDGPDPRGTGESGVPSGTAEMPAALEQNEEMTEAPEDAEMGEREEDEEMGEREEDEEMEEDDEEENDDDDDDDDEEDMETAVGESEAAFMLDELEEEEEDSEEERRRNEEFYQLFEQFQQQQQPLIDEWNQQLEQRKQQMAQQQQRHRLQQQLERQLQQQEQQELESQAPPTPMPQQQEQQQEIPPPLPSPSPPQQPQQDEPQPTEAENLPPTPISTQETPAEEAAPSQPPPSSKAAGKKPKKMPTVEERLQRDSDIMDGLLLALKEVMEFEWMTLGGPACASTFGDKVRWEKDQEYAIEVSLLLNKIMALWKWRGQSADEEAEEQDAIAAGRRYLVVRDKREPDEQQKFEDMVFSGEYGLCEIDTLNDYHALVESIDDHFGTGLYAQVMELLLQWHDMVKPAREAALERENQR